MTPSLRMSSTSGGPYCSKTTLASQSPLGPEGPLPQMCSTSVADALVATSKPPGLERRRPQSRVPHPVEFLASIRGAAGCARLSWWWSGVGAEWQGGSAGLPSSSTWWLRSGLARRVGGAAGRRWPGSCREHAVPQGCPVFGPGPHTPPGAHMARTYPGLNRVRIGFSVSVFA